MKKKSLIFALVLSATLAGGVLRPAMADYANIKEAIQDSANPRTYTLNGSETITSNLGSMGGDGSTLTIDAASPDYSIIGKNGSTQYNGVTVNSGQTLILQNIGKATISDTDYSISDVAGIQNLRQAIINNGTLTIENVVFNKLVSQTSAAIINNANAKITNITGKFLNSGNLDKPPVIYSSAKSSIIERISADFINNKGNQGGAISTMNGGTIDKIVDSRFILNEAKRAAGAIRNGETANNYGGTVNIESSEFKYNYSRAEGGAIVNDYSDAVAGSVMTIKNSVFENNFNVADRTGYGGGAIFHNGKLLELTDTNFKDNITHGDGGALLLNSLTYINADNSDVKFSGNKSKVASISNFNGLNTTYTDGSNTRYNDIYLREGNLYLNANANKSITFDGTLENDSSKNNALFINSDSTIKGGVYNFNNSVSAKNLNIFNDANVKFGSAAQADGTTSYGSLNTQDFTNDTNGGTLDFLNSHIESNTLGNANLNGILNTKIDVDFTNAQSDSFKITGGIGGTINIGAIHFIDENISTNVEKTITILDDSVDKVDLTRTSYPNPEVIGTKETKVLDVKPTAYWDEKFDDIIYSQDVKGAIVLHNSYGDKKDSIKVTVKGFGDSTPIGRVASDKDTLAALNKYVTTEDRAFTANTSSPNYTATEDLGETTAGKFTISGVDGSVLNLGSHTGFELANETTLNLNSLELTGSNPAIAVSNSNAKVNINDVKLNSDITGTTNFDLTTTGDNTVSATITKANIINSGDLTVTKNNAFSDVNLQSSGGSLNLSSGRVESQNFGKVVLSGNTNFAVDADLANVVSDNISATEFEGSGYFSINKINILSDSVVETVRTLVANDVLKAHVKLATTVDITRPSAKDYVITYDDGYLTFTNETPNFVKIARNNAISRSYNMKADVNIANDIADIGDSSTSIGTMGGNVGAEFTVNGNNNYSIDGAGKGGIIIGSGRTLNVNNVGSLNTDGTVKAAWKGFNDAIFTLNSDGVLNFMGENVIANNSTTAQKNIITNVAGNVNFSEGAKLNLIDNTYGSSLIYSSDGTVGDINGIIKGNTINKNANYQGLIYNGSSDADKISKMGDISGTISNNTLKGTNVYGGTIINISKGTSEIGNISADITGNSVTASTGLYGGLIRNESAGGNLKIGDISGKIENNSLVINSVIYGALISNKATNGGNAEIGEISSTITNNTISSNSSNQETTGLISNEGNSNGLANISAITGDILNNTLNLASRRLLGGLVYNFAKTYTASIGDISGKLNNNIINVNGTNGGVIFNAAEGAYNSEIADVTGEISGNKITSVGGNSINGGLIYNYSKSTGVAKMGDISANITDNIVTAKSLVTGGLLYNCKGSSTIEGVSGNVSGNTVITSGEIEGGLINNEGSIGLISGDFTNNYIESTANKVNGGLIYNESGSRAVLTSDITGNYIKSAKPSESNGAVLGNMASITIKDSSITNNASNMLNTISNRGTLNIIADTKDVLFEGNKVKATINRDESTGEVTVSGGEEIDIRNTSNGVLNLYTSQGKTITFNGAITDENNLGTTKVGGTYNDGTGETAYAGNVIFNNTVTQKTLNMANNSVIKLGADDTKYGLLKLNNFTNDTNGGTIDSLNNHIEGHTLGKANLSSAMNIGIDMDIASDLSTQSDTFTLSDYSRGNYNISKLNIMGADYLRSVTEDKEIVQKVLNGANTNTKLLLDDSVKAQYEAAIPDETVEGVDPFTGTTIAYDDYYGGYEFTRSRTAEMSVVGSSGSLKDSIRWAIDVTDGPKDYVDRYDNLYLINTAEGDERTFTFSGTTNTFDSLRDAGVTSTGTLTINGTKDGVNYSTINAGGHNLFVMSNSGTTVNVNNTKITGANKVADIADGNTLNLNNVIMDGGSIVNAGDILVNGTNSLNGNISGEGIFTSSAGKTTLESGSTLNQKELKLQSDDFINNGDITAKLTNSAMLENTGSLTVNGGSINRNDIKGTGTLIVAGGFTNENTVSQGSVEFENGAVFTAKDGSSSTFGNLTNDANGGTFDTNNSTFASYAFGKSALTSALNLALDMDITDRANVKSDTFSLADGSTGTFKVSALDMAGFDAFKVLDTNTSVQKQILTGSTSGVNLDISAIESTYNTEDTQRLTDGEKTFSGTSIYFDEKFGKYDYDRTKKTKITVVGTDTIKLDLTVTDSDPIEFTELEDNLNLINVAEGDNREFKFKTANDKFESLKDAGQTETGKLTVTGFKDGDNYSTIDAKTHNLFDISKSGASVEIKNTKISNAGYVAQVASNNELILDGAYIDSLNVSGIDNLGTLTLNGNNVINKAVTGSGSAVVTGKTVMGANFSQAQLVLESGSELNNDNSAVNIAHSANGYVDTGAKIKGSNGILNLADIRFVNNGTIEQNGLNVTDGSLLGNFGSINVTGSGQTSSNSIIDGSGSFTNDGTFINNGTISQGAITNTGTLTSNASNLKITDDANKFITNKGILNLTGGTIQADITGSLNDTNILGDVTFQNKISYNRLNIEESGTLYLMKEAEFGTDAVLVFDGGTLNLQNQGSTDSFNLGNVSILKNTGLAIDVNMTGSNEKKSADNISMNDSQVYGTAEILINKINLENATDIMPAYAKVADNNLKSRVNIGDNAKTEVPSLSQDGFMITYAKDKGGEAGGYLEFDYANLVSATRSNSEKKVYVIGSNGEDIAQELVSEGGTGITDGTYSFGGKSLSVNGNGQNSVVGTSSTGGTTVGDGQTYSLINIKEYKGFDKAITNNGTVNVTDVVFNNTTDIENNNQLNLYGTDVFSVITGNNGKTFIGTDPNDSANYADATIKSALTQNSVEVSGENNKLTVANVATLTSALTNSGVVDNKGIMNVSGSNTKTVQGEGVFNVVGDFSNTGTLTQGTLGFKDGATLTVGSSASVTAQNLVNDTNKGTFNSLNGVIQDFSLGNAKLSSDLQYKLDVDQNNLKADTFTLSGVDSSSNGKIVISQIQFATGNTYFETPIQVLKGAGSSGIKLAIADGTEYIAHWDDVTKGEDKIDVDTATVKWDDIYGKYSITDNITGKLEVVASDGGTTLKDSLGYVETDRIHGDKVYSEDLDTLALINQYETTLDRQFNFDTDEPTQIYNSKANAGVTSFGKLTVNGIASDKSTINLGDYKGFEITKTEEGKKSTVEIINTTVKGNSVIAEVSNGNELILNGSVTQGSIENNGDITLDNTNFLSGNISGTGVTTVNSGTATLDSSKTLAQSELAVNTDSVFVNNGTSVTAALTNSGTVTNNSLFNVNGGTNSNIINGTNGTLKLTGNFENAATGSINDNIVLINGGKTFTNKGSIDLAGFENDSNGGVLNSKNSAVQTMNLGNVKLNSDLSWIMDAQLKGGTVTTSDNLKADSFDGTGNIIINGINILEDSDVGVMRTLVADDTLKAHVQLATTAEITKELPVTYNYAITYNDGYLRFSRAYNLVTVTRDLDEQRVYNMSSDENIATDIADIGDSSTSIGTMGAAGSTLTINGGGNSINGADNSGITILSGQTLNINNVGKAADGTVKGNGFYGFNGTDANVVLNNSGNLNIENSVFKLNKHNDTQQNSAYSSVIYNSSTGVVNIQNSLFEGNRNEGQGGIGTITNDGYAVITNSEFKNNYAKLYGGSINNRGKMIIGNGAADAITKFTDNTQASLFGYGGIENSGGKLLVNEKTEFTNNVGALTVNKYQKDGVTYNSTVLFDKETLFKDNIDKAALNTQDSKTYVTFAKGSEFTGNKGFNAGAALLQTSSKVLFFDSTFTNNSSTGTSANDGGAIKNGGDLYLIANEGNVEFTGNTANGVSRAIYNDGIVYLNAAEGKSIIFNDGISGASNKDIRIGSSDLEYRTLDSNLNEITKTITQKGGSYIFNDNVENANLKIFNEETVTVGSNGGLNLYQLTSQNQGGTLNVLNDVIQNFTLGNVDIRNKDVNLEIDVSASDLTADKFTITGADSNSNADFLISDIKFANDVSDFGLEQKIRVLENPTDKVGIKLSDELSNQYDIDNYQDVITGNKKIEAVTEGGVTKASVNYDENYGEYTRTDIVHKQLQVTKFDDNSRVDDAIWWKEVSRTEGETIYEKDTLALINQSVTDSEDVVRVRSFNFTGTPTSEYKATSDAGVTAVGNFTVNGVNSDNSIINFAGYKGFEITDTTEKTTVNINNTTIKGASLVADVAQGNELNLKNSVIDSSNTDGITNAGTVNVISSTINQNISGEGATNFSGTSLNTATVTQNAAFNTGVLTNRGTISTITNNAGTIDNYGKLTTSTVNAGVLNNKSDATVDNLTVAGGEVNNSGTITTATATDGTVNNNNDGNITTLTQSGGVANNYGAIATSNLNGGELTNYNQAVITTLNQTAGTLTNNHGASVTTYTLDGGTASNSGLISNAAINQSTLTNNSDGEIVNLTNAATVKNAGIITGNLNNTGTISEGGTITTANGTNSGSITQSSLTSTGTFTNSGTIAVDTLNNTGSDFTNDGTINTEAFGNSGTLTNNNGGKITATGTVQNTGSLTTNASDFKATAGLVNTGDLYLTGGETQNTISGENGTTHIKGNVILSKTISDNVISLDTVSDSVNGVARLGMTDISSASRLLANGGDLNLQYQTGTEDYKLGNVDIQNATGLAIDVDLTGSSAVKKADTISAASVNASEKIYINNLNITTPNPGDAAPDYAKVADNVLKGSVDLGDNTRAHVSSIPQNGFMITYAQDMEGANSGGFLQLAYTDLVTASRAITSNRVYIMGENDEDIVAQIDGNPAGSGYGGSGITDSNYPFGGSALSVNGNGTQSIVGGTLASGNTTGGFIIGNGQTLSLNKVKEVKGFTTGITNNGTVNITDVKFAENTTDIINNNILNLYGKDEIKNISGNNGTLNVNSYNDSNGDEVNANVTFESGGSVVQKAVNIDENNTLNVNSSTFTVTDGITNDGTLNLNFSENNNTITNTADDKGTVNFNFVTKNNADVKADTIVIDGGVALVNTDGKKMSANSIEVKRALQANASDITILDSASSIKNSGIVDFIGGKNENNITIAGSGTNHFVNLTDVTGNTKSIEADNVTYNLSSSSSSVVFNNEGTVSATDLVTNSGNWVNSGDGNIVAKSMVNYKDLVSNADKINITGNNPLDNSQGSFTITGGSNTNFKVSGGDVIIKTDNTAVNDTVNVVNNISADMFRIDKGTAQLVSDDILNYTGRDNGTVLATGGAASDKAILSYINEATSDIKWDQMKFDKDLNVNIDADLTGVVADNFALTGTPTDSQFNNNSQLLIDTIRVSSLPTVKNTKVLVADNNLSEHTNLSNDYIIVNSSGNVISNIVVQYIKDSADNKGYLLFTTDALKNLVTYVREKDASEYTLIENEDIAADIASLGITDNTKSIGALKSGETTFTINGAGFSINGNGKAGITIADGQTLNINNVGADTTSVSNGFYGFAGDDGTYVLDNNGTLNLTSVIFGDNNIPDINNNNTLNLDGTNIISGVSGTAGSTEVKGGTSTIDTMTQKSVTVSGGELRVGDITTSDGITNTVEDGLNLTGGTIDSSVSGDGTAVVSGDVTVKYLNSSDNTTVNKISQAMTVEKTGSLNANVASIGGAVTVNAEGNDIGSVTLYSQEANGGDLNYAITGDGTANFNRNVNVKADVTTKTINVATYNDGSTDYNANVVVADGNQFGVEGGTISVDSGNTLTMNNADNLAADTSNQGTLNLLNGTISKDIDGTGGTTFIKGDVTLASTIKENTISVESDAVANLMTSADIKDAAKFIANGGDLNLQKESSTDAFNLGKVDLQKNMALAIDVDLSHDDGEYNKKADNISASNVSGSANILINNIKISADSNDVIPAYAKVADAKLKGNVNIADDTKVIVPSISGSGPKDSFMITYATDVDGEGGFLKFEYSDLVNAVKSETKTKAYVMTDDENVNEDLMPLGGESLSVSGNGNKITGQGDTKGIAPVKGGQTLSINNVSEMSGFDTAISNKAGTVNLENVTMTGNTLDIQNNKDLNLKGTDIIDTISGEGDTVISTYTDEDDNKVKGDVTVNKELTQDKVTLDSSDDKLTNNGTANINNLDNNGTVNNSGTANVDNLDNSGTVDNSGTLNIKDGNNKGSITGDDGEMNIDGNFVNDSDITQKSVNVGEDADLTNNGDIDSESFTNNGNTDNDSDGTISADKITNNGTLTTDASNLISKNDKPVTNDGSLDFTSGTNKNDIDGNGKTIVSGDVENTGNVNNDVTVNSDASLNNGGSLGGDGKTVTNNGTLANNGNISGTTVNNGSARNNGNIDGKVVNNNKLDNNLSITGDVTNNSDGKIANNSGGSIVGNLNNKGTVDNKGNIIAGNGKSVNNSGTINNTGNLNGNINNKKQGVINTTMKGLDGEVTNRGNIHYTTSGDMRQDIMGDGTIHLDGKGTTKLNADIDGNTLSLNNGNLMFDSNKDISKGGFIANGGNIVGVADGKINTYKLGNTKMAKDAGVDGIDFNLSNLTSDKFIGNFSGNGKFNIDNVRIQGNTLESHIKVSLSDTTNIPDNNLSVKAQKLPDILTPIMWLKGSIEDNYLIYQGRGGGYSDFNPAIMASSVAAHVGGYNAQLEAFEHGFYHMNRYTKYASADRLAAENYNKVASADTATHTVAPQPINPLTEEAIWTKPYTSWESVHLKHGPHVDSFAYGNFFGGDTDLVDIGYGFKGVLSAFIGYNGNHMSYDGVSMDMQGGTLGVTGTAYKGNFFTGLTASTGASGVEAYTSYGTDHFGMINAGVASKSGYNWEIKGGRLIVQPTLLIGYTFVNTFDYKNAAGAKIESDPYSALQIMPELKVIGNTEKGWQPYAKVGMVYNIGLGNRTMTANDVKLPQLSNKPYVQYGVGIQRSWAGRFTAFLETLLRGGGRNGVMLFGGFRWTIGSDGSKPNSKQSNGSNKTIIKANDTLVVPNDSRELQPLPNVNGAVDFEDNIQPAVNKVDNSTISASKTKVVIKKYQPNKKKFLWF